MHVVRRAGGSKLRINPVTNNRSVVGCHLVLRELPPRRCRWFKNAEHFVPTYAIRGERVNKLIASVTFIHGNCTLMEPRA